MSWEAGVFSLLALALATGVWWYERARPPARLVALVAALAALAVAGRLALAPFPNVVATTDIALITGYALGGAPGFAVGALAAPISNLWLGQGPWTVWQTAGWGLAGLLGAWVALATGRRLGRLGLALLCAFAGLAYGALLDLYTMVSFGGEQSLDRYLALSARGLPFNVAHAAGNFAIALAAGPALVEMISRYRIRAEFRWRPAATLPLAAIAAAVALAGSLATPMKGEARSGAAAWLARAQNSDGGFAASPGQPSNPAMTGWAILGLEAAGRNPLDVRSGGRSAVAYLRENVGRLQSVGDLERTILALSAAGMDPRRFGGRDLVGELRRKRRRDGSVAGQVNMTAFFVLALRSAGSDPGDLGRPAQWLRRAQAKNGGWGFRPGAPSDPDSTGAALQALAAASAGGKTIDRGVFFLRRAQDADGGFALSGSGIVNAQSTAWAAQGLAAAGVTGDPFDRALSYLASVRAGDGHYRYSRSSDQTPVWVTGQALLATNRAPFPLARVGRAPARQRSGAEGGSGAGGAAGAGTSPGTTVAPGVGEEDLEALDEAIERAQGRKQGGRDAGSGADRNAGGDGREEPAGGGGEAGGGEGGDPEGGADDDEEEAAGAEADDTAPAAGDDDSDTAPYVFGGIAALAAALALGFLSYRRRLP